jgi:purine-binding chemotaxis protein CheW
MEYQLVIFRLGSEFFGVNITNVESIIKFQPITRLPNTLEFIEGITNLRGRILPVIDLSKRMSMASHELTKESRIMVVAMGEAQVGMIVDAVSEVLTVSEDMIEPTPAIVSGIDTAMITGIAKVGTQENLHPVILLDLGEILSVNERTTIKRMA